MTSGVSLKYQNSGLVLIMNGWKKLLLHVNRSYINNIYQMNIEDQEMETYQLFLVLIDNEKLQRRQVLK